MFNIYHPPCPGEAGKRASLTPPSSEPLLGAASLGNTGHGEHGAQGQKRLGAGSMGVKTTGSREI